MAKITIVGDAVVVTSTLKLEEYKTIEKYRPNALTLMGGEDGKEPVFHVSVSGSGDINQYGASFVSATHDENGYATITMCACTESRDLKEWVADKLGAAIINLNKLEAQLPAVLDEINREKAEVMSNISVVE